MHHGCQGYPLTNLQEYRKLFSNLRHTPGQGLYLSIFGQLFYLIWIIQSSSQIDQVNQSHQVKRQIPAFGGPRCPRRNGTVLFDMLRVHNHSHENGNPVNCCEGNTNHLPRLQVRHVIATTLVGMPYRWCSLPGH